MHGSWWIALLLPPSLPPVPLSLQSIVGAEQRALRADAQGDALAALRPLLVTGTVCLYDGSPAEGAIVLSAQGGRAVTGSSGEFRLELLLPKEVRGLRLTAVHSGAGSSLVSSKSIAQLDARGELDAGSLRLSAGACEPSWLPTFGGRPGVLGEVRALAVFDDGSGSGPALFVGGWFTSAGGLSASRIAKWDGSAWSALGAGLDGAARALASYDEGNGPELHAGGNFIVSVVGDRYLARYAGCAGAGPGTADCFGDGSGAPCPCSNSGGAGEGCANSSGRAALLRGEGTSSVAADDLRCAGVGVRRLGVRVPDAAGCANWGPGLSALGGWAQGTRVASRSGTAIPQAVPAPRASTSATATNSPSDPEGRLGPERSTTRRRT